MPHEADFLLSIFTEFLDLNDNAVAIVFLLATWLICCFWRLNPIISYYKKTNKTFL